MLSIGAAACFALVPTNEHTRRHKRRIIRARAKSERNSTNRDGGEGKAHAGAVRAIERK